MNVSALCSRRLNIDESEVGEARPVEPMPKKRKQTVKEFKNQASVLHRRDVLKGTAAVGLSFYAFAELAMNSTEAAETAGSIFDHQRNSRCEHTGY